MSDLVPNLEEDVLHWQERAAEALEGPDAVYDPRDRQHKAAVLLLALDAVDAEAPEAADHLCGATRYRRAFVEDVLRRYRNGDVRPGAFALYNLPGPDFEVIRDVQVGLGLAYRHPLARRRVAYDFTDTARRNIARLERIHRFRKGPQDPRDISDDPAPAVQGALRRKRGVNAFGVAIGSTLILMPHERKARLAPGARVRVELAGMTAWLRIERMLERPQRYEVRLLALSSDAGAPERLLGTLQMRLRGGRAVHSLAVAEPTVFRLSVSESDRDLAA